MSSIVQELQRDALNQSIGITALLQKCLVVAVKLNQTELASWVRQELDGYKDSNVPEYRVVSGTPQALNPVRGYQTIEFQDAKHARACSTMHFNQSIGEIEFDLHPAKQEKERGNFYVSYPPEKEQALMKAMNVRMQPVLHISPSQLQKILDGVRKIVLEWSLKLEADGILGEGMTFSDAEKQIANSATFHVQNYFHGTEHSQIQINSPNSVQNLNEFVLDLSKLQEILNEIKQSNGKLDLSETKKAELQAEVSTLEAQVNSPNPKPSIVRESLVSMRTILEGAAGNLIASGIVAQIGALFGS